MARQVLIGNEKASEFKGKINDNFEELYDIAVSTKRGWGYQDFLAGTIVGTTVTITANNNGTGITFDPLRMVGNSAAICLADNNLNIPYTGTTTWFSSKVTANGNTGDSVTLSGVPHASWGNVRIFYLYDYINKIPEGNIIAPKFLSAQVLTALDLSFVTEEEYSTRIQGGSVSLAAGTHTILLPYAYENTNYRVTGDAYDNDNNEIGYTILRSSKTTSSFDVWADSDCIFEWLTIKL